VTDGYGKNLGFGGGFGYRNNTNYVYHTFTHTHTPVWASQPVLAYGTMFYTCFAGTTVAIIMPYVIS